MASPKHIEGHGITLTFGTSAYAPELLGISGFGATRQAIDITHQGVTGAMQKMAATLTDNKPVKMDIAFAPNFVPPISSVQESLIIVFPVGPGGSTAGNFTGNGFITDWEATGKSGDRMTGSFDWTWAGNVTINPGT